MAHKHRYEPRFDDNNIGAEKHFPELPCLAWALDELNSMEVIDKKSETDFAGWLKRRNKKGTLRHHLLNSQPALDAWTRRRMPGRRLEDV